MTMLAEYGTMSLKEVLAPAMQMAAGYPIEAQTANSIERQKAMDKGVAILCKGIPASCRRETRSTVSRRDIRPDRPAHHTDKTGGGRTAGSQKEDNPERRLSTQLMTAFIKVT